MPSYTIANSSVPAEILLTYYASAKTTDGLSGSTDLDYIFSVAEQERSLFPGINLTGTLNAENYLIRWVKGYTDAMNNLPSLRTANPKSACTDPAIRVIVQGTQGMTNEQASDGEKCHNLFMSAEIFKEIYSKNILQQKSDHMAFCGVQEMCYVR